MILLLIISIFILVYYIFLRKNLLHPFVYFWSIMTVSVLLTFVDYYNILVKISQEAILVLGIGMLGFLVGTIPNVRFVLRKSTLNTKIAISKLYYKKEIVYIFIAISLVFNIIMSVITTGFLLGGYEYSQIRDILFSYDDLDITFFASTFLSTFYSWVATPCTYIISSIIILEFFEKKFAPWFKVLCSVNIALYVYSSAGRFILVIMLLQTVFAMVYYKKQVSAKSLKRIIKIGILLIAVLFIMTYFRTKEVGYYRKNVNSAYAYFSINIPLLSFWVEQVKESNIYCMGNGFFMGVLQFINFFTMKVGITTPMYNETVSLIAMPQERWLEIYDGYWYNAFCSILYSFYIDFRKFGVFLGTFLFGFICKFFYNRACIERNKNYLLLYMILIQVMVSSFVRWQLGTLTFLITVLFSVICINWGKGKKYE